VFHYPTSTSSRQVRLILAEKQVTDIKWHVVNLEKLEQLAPWYAQLNHKCVVPTLIDLDGTVVTDAKEICFWITNRNSHEGIALSRWRALCFVGRSLATWYMLARTFC
jgi:glutathione S-transferase